MATDEQFSLRLRQLALQEGLTQTDVARACGVTPQSAQRWFAGAALPRASHLPKLAQTLNVPLNALTDNVPALNEDRTSSPPPENATAQALAMYYDGQKEYTAVRRKADLARATAQRMVAVHILENLSWAGYNAPDTDYIESDGRLTVVGPAGKTYLILVRVSAPHPTDLGLVHRAAQWKEAEGVTFLLSYVYLDRATGELATLMIPAITLDGDNPEDAREILRTAARWVSRRSRLIADRYNPFSRATDSDEDGGDELPAPLADMYNNYDLDQLVLHAAA